MKTKVLIIEDDRDLASLFKIVLEMSGFEVDTVHDGTKGVEVLTTQPLPDAILLDMHLPGVSGEEIYALMKERGDGRRVVICSADVQLVERYKSLGANAITKPAPINDLQRMIMNIVSGQDCEQISGEKYEFANI
ncbi:MAG TPA: response regulator [Anaerolineales bacterium]|nr:response regulator [Anaerolineales bacterium]